MSKNTFQVQNSLFKMENSKMHAELNTIINKANWSDKIEKELTAKGVESITIKPSNVLIVFKSGIDKTTEQWQNLVIEITDILSNNKVIDLEDNSLHSFMYEY